MLIAVLFLLMMIIALLLLLGLISHWWTIFPDLILGNTVIKYFNQLVKWSLVLIAMGSLLGFIDYSTYAMGNFNQIDAYRLMDVQADLKTNQRQIQKFERQLLHVRYQLQFKQSDRKVNQLIEQQIRLQHRLMQLRLQQSMLNRHQKQFNWFNQGLKL